MIQKLVEAIVALLRQKLADVGPHKMEQHIVAGPLPEAKPELAPLIALYPANLEFSQTAKDVGGGQPRPQPTRQIIEVKSARSKKKYKLTPTPLKDSARCKLILGKDTLTESQQMLLEDKDFTIDYPKSTISLLCDLKPPSRVLLDYSFAGIFTIREFKQELIIDIYDTQMAAVEKWTALTTGIILMNVKALIESCNNGDEVGYQSKQIAATPYIDRIQIMEGTPILRQDACQFKLKCHAAGHLKLAKEISDGFNRIEQVLGPEIPPDKGSRIFAE
jgi:hypothetical protein